MGSLINNSYWDNDGPTVWGGTSKELDLGYGTRFSNPHWEIW